MFWELKVEKIFFFSTMTTPGFFQHGRDLAQYIKARLRSSQRPMDPRPAPPKWLLAPGPYLVAVEKVICLLEEASSRSCKSYIRPVLSD